MQCTKRRITASELGFAKRQSHYELWGELPAEPRLAVVGSRAALTLDLPGVQRLVRCAGEQGWTLVSGGALGVDGWMHQAALNQGVAQLAVLPCTPDIFYPPRHTSLFYAIAQQDNSGLLFSLARGRPQARHVFVARNEIVLRSCQSIVVVQSQPKSGSMWTARRALALGKRVAVFEGSSGSSALLEAGAHSLGRTQDSDQAARIHAWLRQEHYEFAAPQWPEHLIELRRAFQHAGPGAHSVDAFADPLIIAMQLSDALDRGLVQETGPGRYMLRGG